MPFATPLIRQELYEWWTSVRYAIDWKQLVAENRSRGRKHLARFPMTIIRLKVQHLLQYYTHACLLNGVPPASFTFDGHWFLRWQDEYGLSMKRANRKYAVPRHVVKERLEVFWVVLFRIRLLIFLVFGYDPILFNFDQTPFHNNEVGSQDKPILAVANSIVPVVEGNTDVESRWTGN